MTPQSFHILANWWKDSVVANGWLDIIFGAGLGTLILWAFRRLIPTNCESLHVDRQFGGGVSVNAQNFPLSLSITLTNSGNANIYVARAYFKPRYGLFRSRSKLAIFPASAWIADKRAYELKFQNPQGGIAFSTFETILQHGPSNARNTWLALTAASMQEVLDKRQCGTLYIEYARTGQMGVHKVRI